MSLAFGMLPKGASGRIEHTNPELRREKHHGRSRYRMCLTDD